MFGLSVQRLAFGAWLGFSQKPLDNPNSDETQALCQQGGDKMA